MNKLELININGNSIEIDLSDELVRNHFAKDSNYGVHILRQINNGGCDIMKQFIPDGSVCLDIGANVGLVSLYMAERCTGIHAWEPNKSNFEILQKLTLKYDNIIPTKRALSAKDELIKFYECDFNSTMNSLIDFSAKNNYEEVAGRRLDTFVDKLATNVDFAKIDIEGSEVIALTEEILNNCKDVIKAYYLEIHDTRELNGQDQYGNLTNFIRIFSNLGYNIERVNHMVDNVTIICY